MAEFEGVEVWRGRVNPWEVDSMGHLNVRYYGVRMAEGLVGLAAAMGLPDAFKAGSDRNLAVHEQHVRFLKEARSDAPLHMTAGVASIGALEARVLFQMIHSLTGELAAAWLVTVSQTVEGGSQIWSDAMRAACERIVIRVPDRAHPRSLSAEPKLTTKASLKAADRLGLRTISAGAFGPQDCDVFGRMRPDQVITRISDGMSHLFAGLGGRGGEGPLLNPEDGPPRRTGGAVLEYRVKHWATPLAGDRFVVRSGVAAVEDRFQRLVHWMLDPQTGRPWATAEAISISLDLEARKVLAYTSAHRRRLEENVVHGLTL